jgi:hypothetical protein
LSMFENVSYEALPFAFDMSNSSKTKQIRIMHLSSSMSNGPWHQIVSDQKNYSVF